MTRVLGRSAILPVFGPDATLIAEEVPSLRGYTVEWADHESYYLSRRAHLYHSTTLVEPFVRVTTIPAPAWRRIASRARLAQRLLRFMVTNVLVLPNGELFITFDNSVGVIRDGTFVALTGLTRPCRVLRSGCAVNGDGNVYFGEYRLNAERDEVHIYRYSPGDSQVEVAYTFERGSIAHVHGMYCDDITGALYCLTGDDARECQILRSADGCRSFETVGERDETWRAVSVVFGLEYFLYGTDASFRSNHIYRTHRSTLKRSVVGEVDGPVLFSKRLGDAFIFSTSAEAAPSQEHNVASLWRTTESGSCEKVMSFKKDRWNKTLFKLGAIHFPTFSASADELYFHLVAVKGDNRTFRMSVEVDE